MRLSMPMIPVVVVYTWEVEAEGSGIIQSPLQSKVNQRDVTHYLQKHKETKVTFQKKTPI